jgi:hypothetical protein
MGPPQGKSKQPENSSSGRASSAIGKNRGKASDPMKTLADIKKSENLIKEEAAEDGQMVTEENEREVERKDLAAKLKAEKEAMMMNAAASQVGPYSSFDNFANSPRSISTLALLEVPPLRSLELYPTLKVYHTLEAPTLRALELYQTLQMESARPVLSMMEMRFAILTLLITPY